jgi:hypothetical protein
MAEREPLLPPGRRSRLERQADEVASDVALRGARPSGAELERGAREALQSSVQAASDQPIRSAVGSRLGVDLSGIRLVRDSPSVQAVRSIAFAQHDEVHLAPGAYRPDHPLGRALLAHELTHSAQLARMSGFAPETALAHDRLHDTQSGARADSALKLRLEFCPDSSKSSGSPSATTAPSAAPPTPAGPSGATVRGSVDPQISAYNAYDAIRLALEEVKKGKALEFHAKFTRAKVDDLCKNMLKLSAADQTARLSDFDALLSGAPPKAPAKWDASRAAFLAAIKPPIVANLEGAGMTLRQQNQNLNWLQNMPAQVMQLLLDVSNPNVPSAYLYSAAVNEGLVDVYVRGQVSGASDQLTPAQLASISVTAGVSGFQALGLDRYFEEIAETKHPLTGHLPSGFDATKVTEESNVNEKGTAVRSAHVADLKTGLQVQAAILARRMDLFLDAVKEFGFAAPTAEEKVFFGYIFYNSGSAEGRRTLRAHKPGSKDPRTLGKWISGGDYPNAQKVLRTYRFAVAAGFFKGF